MPKRTTAQKELSYERIKQALDLVDDVLCEDEEAPCFPQLVKAVTYLEEALEKLDG